MHVDGKHENIFF